MIARLSGKLFFKSTSHIIIDVHGVGYQVSVPLSSYYPLGNSGDDVALFIHTYVREDALHLFGFITEEEKKIFELLMSVSKIGPKLAINILSNISVADLISAVTGKDLVALTSISGIGKKTAERMLLDLRDKMESLPFAPAAGSEKLTNATDNLSVDALSALVNLGYKKDMAEKAIKKVRSEGDGHITLEDVIKRSLRKL